MFAKAGGKPDHSLIATNVSGVLRHLLKGRRCTPYNSELRIGIPSETLYTYPDVSVFCEPMPFVEGTDDTATNPTVIVEVLSPSTESYDRAPERRLRIGYVSPDFWRHVICHVLTPLLETHDHTGFEIFCYASVRRADAITEWLKMTADVRRNALGVRDEALEEKIRLHGRPALRPQHRGGLSRDVEEVVCEGGLRRQAHGKGMLPSALGSCSISAP